MHPGLRFLGEFFGVCHDRVPPSRAMVCGSYVAGFGYVLILVGVLIVILAHRYPDLSAPARLRIASTIGIVVYVSLPYLVPILPRVLRVSMVGVFVLILVGSDIVKRISMSASRTANSVEAADCAIISEQQRTPPTVLHLDSFAFAIENDITSIDPDGYLDLIYTAVLTYSARNPRWARGVTEALTALELEGPAYERFGGQLGSYRIRQAPGGDVADVWFCGFDMECGTCDDRKGYYPWPSTRAEAETATPQLMRGAVDRTAEVLRPDPSNR